MRLVILSAAFFLLVAFTGQCFAALVAFENFDGGAVNLTSTTNVSNYGAGGGALGDVFGRVSQFAGGAGTGGPFDVWDDSVTDTSNGGVNTSDALAVAGQRTSAFFAMNDMDGPDGPGLSFAIWTFDISLAPGPIESIKIDLAAFGDFEAGASSDGFLIEARIDANAFTEIFSAETDEAASKMYRAFDDGDVFTLDDPLELHIDGVATGTYLDKSDPSTGDFDTYTSFALAGGSGSTLDVRVSWDGTPSGSEPMGIDNITINAVPEPGAILFGTLVCGVIGLGIGGRRLKNKLFGRD